MISGMFRKEKLKNGYDMLLNYCYGCGACAIECSTKAITMQQNQEGFFYPTVDDKKCVDCGKCMEVCPVLATRYEQKKPLKGYAYMGREELRDVSSSGGAFGAIAEGIIHDGGCVCGSAFSDDYRYAEHIIIDDVKDLQKIQKSKYIQSRTGDIYKSIRNILDTGRTVFFCGTPCQVAGLRSFLRKEYDNLLTADLLCHAANSEVAWQEFISEKGDVTEADFRDKTRYFPFALRLHVDGEDVFEPQSECDFMQGFYAGIFCRDSCDSCPFPYFNRVGDITLADFWGVENVLPEIDYKNGCSAVLANTEKGQGYVDRFLAGADECLYEVNPNDIISQNGAAEHCFHNHPGKGVFFDKLDNDGFKCSYDEASKEIFAYGLVGFWYTPNYGAALNAFALANSVRSLGYSVLMIEAPGTQYDGDAHVYETDSPVRTFISQYFPVSNRQNSCYELQKLNDECKGFLLGSDQLWRWQPGGYHFGGAYYVLDFVNAVKKKVAYGTSFGKTEFHGDTEDVSAFVLYLRRFADVSVREQDAVGLCAKRFGVTATWVVDPVFLLSADEYRLAAKRSTMEIPLHDNLYIFVYLLQPTKEKNEIIRRTASTNGMKIIAVSDLYPKYNEAYECDEWEFEHYTKIEVADWLKLIENAEYVITDSYHGFCFSIIFRKQFIALTPRDGLNRFQTIAEMTGLEERIDIGRIEELDSDLFSEIDYDAVWTKLQPEIERSRKWLSDALTKEYVPKELDYLYDVMRFENLRIREDYERKLQISRDQYFSMSCKLRRQSYVTRKYIVRDYLIDRLKGKSVAIRGAGGHTNQILGILSDSAVNIKCVWDKNVSADTYDGVPVVKNITDTEMRFVDAVLISSWKYRKEMKEDVLEEIEKNNVKGIDVVDFYEELQQKGIPIDSEYFWFDWDFQI